MFFFGTRIRKDLVVQEGTIPSEKVSLPMDTPAWQENQVDLSYVWAISYSHLNSYKTQLNMSYKQMASPNSSWRLHIQGKGYFNSSATVCRQQALISDFLDLAKLSIREQAALAMNWIKDRPEGLMLQNLALATMTSHAMSSLPENTTADFQHAINKCETLGSGKQLSHHGNP